MLPDTLQLLTSTLRSGYGLLQALDSVAQEAAEPARSEFRRVLLEIRVGTRPVEPRSAPSPTAWRARTSSGWSAPSRSTARSAATWPLILESTAETIRERQRVSRQMRALTAEGRLSAYILTALPVVVALAMTVHQPGYLRPARARASAW